MRRAIWVIVILVALGAGVWAVQYFALFQPRLAATPTDSIIPPTTVATSSNPATPIKYVVEEFAHGLVVPWSLVFTAPNRMLVAERPGRVVALVDGKISNTPLYTFTEVATNGEEGLMSLALSPQYATDKLIYAAVAYESGKTSFVKIVTLHDRDTSLELDRIIIDKIPAAQYHAGTALAFGPDGKLYVSTGDATDRAQAQNMQSLSGKILRLNPDGTIPTDNPFGNSPVYSFGHRNPQGLAWLNGRLYESEHGPSIFDGPAGGDEVNLISTGKNYGWPLVSHGKLKDGTEPALRVFTPAEAPASLLAYTVTAIPQFTGNLFFGALKGEGLVRLVLDPNNPHKIINVEKLAATYGRIRAVAQGPDGAIYFSTSNRDGRGTPTKTDDRIFRIRPE